MSRNILFLFTQTYPYGKEETFISGEIDFIVKKFDKVIIISNSISNEIREIPKSIELYSLTSKRVSLKNFLKIFLSLTFWKEFNYFLRTKPISLFNFGILKTFLKSAINSIVISNEIQFLVKKDVQINDSLFFYSYWINDFALSFINLKRKLEGKYFCRAHGWDVFTERSKFNYLPFRSFLPDYIDFISFISNTGKDYFVNKYGSFDNLTVSKLGVRSNYVFGKIEKKDKITILSCSLIIPIKRIDLIVRSLSLINSQKYEWIHIGYDNNSGLTNEISRLANELNVNLKIVGYLDNSRVLDFYKNNKIDLFISLSETEGLPVSIMEAYSNAVPAVATNVGGTSEIVNNENGYLIESNPSPELVAEKINYFINLNVKEKNTKRQLAYDKWLKEFNRDENYNLFYQELL